jgi:hypothetical protein
VGLTSALSLRPSAGRTLSALIAGSNRVTVREYQSAVEVAEIFEDFFLAESEA